MSDPYRAPFYSFENLRAFADRFLREHHPSGSIPIPIEEIADWKAFVSSLPDGIRRQEPFISRCLFVPEQFHH